jgi:hypothetical protein
MSVLPYSPHGDVINDKNLSLPRSYFITVWQEIKPKTTHPGTFSGEMQGVRKNPAGTLFMAHAWIAVWE